jgi:hypothetical protein
MRKVQQITQMVKMYWRSNIEERKDPHWITIYNTHIKLKTLLKLWNSINIFNYTANIHEKTKILFCPIIILKTCFSMEEYIYQQSPHKTGLHKSATKWGVDIWCTKILWCFDKCLQSKKYSDWIGMQNNQILKVFCILTFSLLSPLQSNFT